MSKIASLLFIIVVTQLPQCSCFTTPTPLRKIITLQTISSSVVTMINREFIADSSSIYNDLVTYHSHIQADLFFTTILAFTLFIEHSYYYQKKWKNIAIYENERKMANVIITLLFILLTRNVDNAI